MISINEYQNRRRRLAIQLPENSIALIPAATEAVRNGDAHYRFRQDSDFYYLTGFNEPDAVLLIGSGKSGTSVLFNRPRNFAEEQWTGQRLGQEDACTQLGIDDAYPLDRLRTKLPELLTDKKMLFYPIGRYPAWDTLIMDTWKMIKTQSRRGMNPPDALGDVAPLLGEMRLFKSEAELCLMREAARITVAAHQRAMRACRHSHVEYELEAEIIHELTRQGCRNVAYDSIVAAGNNACVLHYTDNNQALRSGDLVLIDAGGEFQNYAADVTRTFPINGRFNVEQKLIYELVLASQKAGLDRIRPGCLWDDVQQAVVHVLTSGLIDLGLLRGSLDDLIATAAYKPFYMHRSGHWLGLDVHDVGRYKNVDENWRKLESGMVLTVEPGLYIHPSIQGIDSRWHGIGVRIEDDIHVTKTGYENLTAALAVNVDEIEALVCG
jgi:Xaa-Pro aminopeptidase